MCCLPVGLSESAFLTRLVTYDLWLPRSNIARTSKADCGVSGLYAMVRAVCRSTVLLALTWKEVVRGVVNGVASGLRVGLCEGSLEVGAIGEVRGTLVTGGLEQMEWWCLPPHFEHLDLDRHSRPMWPLLRQTKQRPDLRKICFRASTWVTVSQVADG